MYIFSLSSAKHLRKLTGLVLLLTCPGVIVASIVDQHRVESDDARLAMNGRQSDASGEGDLVADVPSHRVRFTNGKMRLIPEQVNESVGGKKMI